MKGKTSRRDFLGISALGLAAIGPLVREDPSKPTPWVSQGKEARAGSEGASGEIAVWVTAGDDRFAAAPGAEWQPVSATGTPSPAASPTGTGARIELDPNRRFQEILGFGGALTDASCYLFNQLAPDAREQLFHELFHPSEMGLSVCRICVGSSDYRKSFIATMTANPIRTLRDSRSSTTANIFCPCCARRAKRIPELFLFSSPWSPPGWMKFNGSMLGGSMRKHYLPIYAQYHLKFLQGYAAEGVPVQAMTSQNEVDTDQDGKMPACVWAQEYEIAIRARSSGPAAGKQRDADEDLDPGPQLQFVGTRGVHARGRQSFTNTQCRGMARLMRHSPT